MKHSYKTVFVLVMTVLITACSSIQKKGAPDNKEPEFIPKLKRPEVRKVWVPDQISGDEYITGHWKFVLQKNSVWTKEN